MSTESTDAQVASIGSPLDELRQEFAKKVEPPRLRKRFPAVGGKLVGEYRIAPKADVRAAAETENDEYLLSQALVRILIVDDTNPLADKDGLVPLGEWADSAELDPLGFDNRLARLVGIPEGSPSEIALRLYDGNDLLLAQHVGELAEWSLDVTNKAYQDFPSA